VNDPNSWIEIFHSMPSLENAFDDCELPTGRVREKH
jgi:hypothetical protein